MSNNQLRYTPVTTGLETSRVTHHRDRWVSYKNGNYTVLLDLETGTKIRKNDLDFFEADRPESFDLKITNQCDMNCPFCHENSTPDGEHADILNAKFMDSLPPYTEIAIGGGNPLSHPDLIEFLYRCKELKLIPSMTVNKTHFVDNKELLKQLCSDRLIYGLGVSVHHITEGLIQDIKEFPNAVCHVINGVVTPDEMERLKNNNLKILILGYKEFRRGDELYRRVKTDIDHRKKWMYDHLEEMIKDGWFSVVSFDNLAIKQLDPSRLLTEEQYKQFYMGDDGQATMFIDLVKNEFAVGSTYTDRYPVTDNIYDMFKKVKEVSGHSVR